MKVPFDLRVKSGKTVTVVQAEVRHYRTAKKLRGKYLENSNEKGGATFVSYYIKNNEGENGRIYTGFAICSYSDNFGRRYGRRIAELRAINNKRHLYVPIFESLSSMSYVVDKGVDMRALKSTHDYYSKYGVKNLGVIFGKEEIEF